jgi:TfoX/Sxy family transcriptional regulator of competence genes
VAYDEDLANRLRELLQDERGLTEKKMFGGLAFLINGNMAVAASGQGGLLLRVDPDRTEGLASRSGVRRFEMRGREMDGWLRIEESAARSKRDLERWVQIGVEYAKTLAKK